MFKKVVILCAAVIGISATDAMAIPTVRKNGISNSSTVSSRTGKLPTNVKTVDNRMSLTNAVKNFKITQSPVTTGGGSNSSSGGRPGGSTGGSTGGNTSGNTGGNSPSISSNDLVAITDRVSALEAQTDNMITDVEISESGNYVTDVSINGNKLNINKTREILVPVRTGTTITSSAEVWIEK